MDTQKKRIAVVGGGSWATANVKMLTDNITPKEVFWWMRNPQAVEHIQKFKHNPNYLSSVDVKMPPCNISTNLKHIINSADFILLNVPAAFLKQALEESHRKILQAKKLFPPLRALYLTKTRLWASF